MASSNAELRTRLDAISPNDTAEKRKADLALLQKLCPTDYRAAITEDNTARFIAEANRLGLSDRIVADATAAIGGNDSARDLLNLARHRLLALETVGRIEKIKGDSTAKAEDCAWLTTTVNGLGGGAPNYQNVFGVFADIDRAQIDTGQLLHLALQKKTAIDDSKRARQEECVTLIDASLEICGTVGGGRSDRIADAITRIHGEEPIGDRLNNEIDQFQDDLEINEDETRNATDKIEKAHLEATRKDLLQTLGALRSARDLMWQTAHRLTLRRASLNSLRYALQFKALKLSTEAAHAKYKIHVVNEFPANDAMNAKDIYVKRGADEPPNLIVRFRSGQHPYRIEQKTFTDAELGADEGNNATHLQLLTTLQAQGLIYGPYDGTKLEEELASIKTLHAAVQDIEEDCTDSEKLIDVCDKLAYGYTLRFMEKDDLVGDLPDEPDAVDAYLQAQVAGGTLPLEKNIPTVIKIADRYVVYGAPDGKTWKFTELDDKHIPADFADDQFVTNKRLCDEIAAKQGHLFLISPENKLRRNNVGQLANYFIRAHALADRQRWDKDGTPYFVERIVHRGTLPSSHVRHEKSEKIRGVEAHTTYHGVELTANEVKQSICKTDTGQLIVNEVSIQHNDKGQPIATVENKTENFHQLTDDYKARWAMDFALNLLRVHKPGDPIHLGPEGTPEEANLVYAALLTITAKDLDANEAHAFDPSCITVHIPGAGRNWSDWGRKAYGTLTRDQQNWQTRYVEERLPGLDEAQARQYRSEFRALRDKQEDMKAQGVEPGELRVGEEDMIPRGIKP